MALRFQKLRCSSFCSKKTKEITKNITRVFFAAVVVGLFFTLASGTYILGQESQPVQESSALGQSPLAQSPLPESSLAENSPTTEVAKPAADVPVRKKKTKKQKVTQEAVTPNNAPAKATSDINALRLQWQFSNAPEDPIFAYEKRYVPLLNPPQDFTAPQVEKEIIVERLEKEKVDYKELAKKYIPNTLQIIVISVVLIIFIIYRIQISSGKKRRKIFKVKK